MRPRSSAALTLVLATMLGASVAEAKDTWTTPYPGVRHLFRTTTTPQRIFVLEVDLCQSGVVMRATRTGERGRTTSSYGNLAKVQATINGDLFSANNNYRTSGLAAGGGGLWADTKDNTSEGFLAFGPERAGLSIPKTLVDPPDAWMHEVVGGRPQVVKDGVPLASDPADVACDVRNPRTAAGLSRDGRILYLTVVDGRTEIAAGMKCSELGDLMFDLGAWNALNYDGGGSSTMWIASEGVVNVPSDGPQRVVANHLGLFAPAATTACAAGCRWETASVPPSTAPRGRTPPASTRPSITARCASPTSTATDATTCACARPATFAASPRPAPASVLPSRWRSSATTPASRQRIATAPFASPTSTPTAAPSTGTAAPTCACADRRACNVTSRTGQASRP